MMQWIKTLGSSLPKKAAGWVLAGFVLAGLTTLSSMVSSGSFFSKTQPQTQTQAQTICKSALPIEAQRVLVQIRKGGPYAYPKDGTVFRNFEKRLPVKSRGYYTEYTVKTPGVKNRGARRIVAGQGATGTPSTSGEYWYTADHYEHFARVVEQCAR